MIMHLTTDQLSLTREIAHAFFQESQLPGVFNWKHWLDCWSAIIDKGMGVIIVYFDQGIVKGVIGGISARCLNTGDLEIFETFWYVFPEYRKGTKAIRLLQDFEKWGQSIGAKRVKMAHLMNLNGAVMRRMYTAMGYAEQETTFRKEFNT